jgi:hypothetical protein
LIEPEWFNSILGFFMPILVNYLTMKNWKREIKTLIAILISLLIGLISTYLQGLFNLKEGNFFYTFMEIFTTSQIAYNLFWKGLFNP